METTEIQKQIENYVTSGRGYSQREVSKSVRDSEMGLQKRLASMDFCAKRLSVYEAFGFSSLMGKTLNLFKKLEISPKLITNLYELTHCLYLTAIMETLLDNY